MNLPVIDVVVLVVYLVGTLALGCWFLRRSRTPESFTSAGGSMPGIVVGLSIFGTFVSSISFLAYPGKALVGNWNAFVFSLSLPIAAFVAVRWFVPYYRKSGAISAYHNLETRFGVWARLYASCCYLLTQIARMGSVMFLLALALNQVLNWEVIPIILVLGGLTTLYTMLGGIEGVIWTDALQSFVLIVGALACAVLIPFDMPEGPLQVFTIAAEHAKFSLGSFGPSLSEPTFWVVLIYGLVMNLQNFGIDQSYAQRYLTASSMREAKKSVWLGALLYLPISAFFLFIGTALFAYCTAHPEFLPADIQEQVALGKGEGVFPYFIVHRLPTGMSGLLIAAVFAAAMSTLSSSLNSSATLIVEDFYKRFFAPEAAPRRIMTVLYAATAVFGLLGTGMALAMIRAKGILDAWWALSGVFGGGMLGIFLLGILSHQVRNAAAVSATIGGVLLIFWMTFSKMEFWTRYFDKATVCPFDTLLVNVFGTAAIMMLGFAVTLLFCRPVEE